MKKQASTTQWIAVNKLTLDPRVNRALDERHSAGIRTKFHRPSLGILTVSARPDGTYVVIDGQHRYRALVDLGMVNSQVECKVLVGLTLAEEARLFVQLNAVRRPQALDIFLKSVTAGDPDAVAIDGILKDHGLTVSWAHADGNIAAVQAVQSLYNNDRSGKLLSQVLHIVTSSWGRTIDAVNGHLLNGIGQLLMRYGDQVDVDGLISNLAKFPGGAVAFVGKAKAAKDLYRCTMPRAVAAFAVQVYNQRRRAGTLPPFFG